MDVDGVVGDVVGVKLQGRGANSGGSVVAGTVRTAVRDDRFGLQKLGNVEKYCND